MLRKILEFHAQRYPLIQPADAVKLLYQHSFGVGHLIADRKTFMDRLEREMAAVRPNPAVPLTEPIGNGLVRVMLNSPEFRRFSTESLTGACIRTAECPFDTPDAFRKKISELEAAVREGLFSFTPEALASYLAEYRAAGFPPVSHSEIYRAAYHPAYRVVKDSFLK